LAVAGVDPWSETVWNSSADESCVELVVFLWLFRAVVLFIVVLAFSCVSVVHVIG